MSVGEEKELAELREELEDDDPSVRVTPLVPKSLYDQFEKAAKADGLTVNQYVRRAAERYMRNGRGDGNHQDLRDLCDLTKMHAEATHPRVKEEIAGRVRRDYNIDLNGGGNPNPKGGVGGLWAAYQKAPAPKDGKARRYKTVEAFKAAMQLKPHIFADEMERFAIDPKIYVPEFCGDPKKCRWWEKED